MRFEYDPNKSATNKAKHGIDFDEAQELWEGTYIVAPLGNGHGEERLAVFGLIREKHWTAVVTERNGNIRIISVRRSREKEEAYYDRKKKISVEEFDKLFDEGKEDIMAYLDLDKAKVCRSNTAIRRVNVDFPEWMIEGLDVAAESLAINRQAVIKTWIADRLRQERIA